MTRIVLVGALCLAAGVVCSTRALQADLPTPGFHHLHLNSTDPDGAIAFYVRNFPTTTRATALGLPALKTGHVFVLFTKVGKPPADQPQSAYWHFGWHVQDTRAYWTRYKDAGAPLMPLYTDDGGSVTFSNEWWPGTLTKATIPAAVARGTRSQNGGYGYLRGPDGVKIEFQGDLPAERFNHVHMYQDDVFCAEIWYAKHLNAPLSGSARRAEGRKTSESDCTVMQGDPSWLSLVPQGTKRTPAGGVLFDDVEMNWYQRQGSAPLASSRGQTMDHVGLSVGDLNAWYDKLRAEGVTVLGKPHKIGDTRAFIIEGPSRERIELVQLTHP